MKRFQFLSEFGKAFIPEQIRPHLRKYLLRAGIVDVPYQMFGILFIVSLVVTYFIYLLLLFPIIDVQGFGTITLAAVTFVAWFIVNMAVILLVMSCIYFYWDILIYERTKKIEEVLIEFLEFVSENLKGGMSFDKALWSAVKPKFQVLSSEIRIAAKKAMTGEDVEDALIEFTEKYDSPTVKRTFNLIVEGMRGGGELASILDRIIDNLKETRELKEDMVTTSLSYVIFITFIVLVIAPGLFALSKQLLVILGGFAEKLGSSLSGGATSGVVPISFESIAITPDDFVLFSRSALAVICLFSAMIISIIKDGNVKDGLKYIPFFIGLSIGLMTLFSFALETIMSGLFGLG